MTQQNQNSNKKPLEDEEIKKLKIKVKELEDREQEIKEPEPETLEQIADQPEQQEQPTTEDFVDFFTTTAPATLAPAPVLPTTTPAPAILAPATTDLEDATASAPAAPTVAETGAGGPEDYIITYNEPDYTTATSRESDEAITAGMQDSHIFIRSPEIISEQRPMPTREMSEMEQIRRARPSGQGAVNDYVIKTDMQRPDDERKLPFEEKTKYKGKRI